MVDIHVHSSKLAPNHHLIDFNVVASQSYIKCPISCCENFRTKHLFSVAYWYVTFMKKRLRHSTLLIIFWDLHCIFAEFASVCQQSTDFHFPDLEQQFEKIEFDVMKANEWRTLQKLSEEGDQISVKSSSSGSSEVSLKCFVWIEHQAELILIHSLAHFLLSSL